MFSTRSVTTSAATFVAADMNAVTGVGEPWYTSGVHMWNGAAEALKPSPVSTIARPTTSIRSSSRVAPTWPMPARSRWPVAPKTSANPNRSTAEPKLPTIRYLRPDSSDVSRSMSIAQST